MMRLITKERIFRVSVSGEPLEFLIDPCGAAVLIRKGSGVGDCDIPESAYNSVKRKLPDNHTLRCVGHRSTLNRDAIGTVLVWITMLTALSIVVLLILAKNGYLLCK